MSTAGAADLVEAIMRHILQHDGLHGEHVGKLHLRDVEGTHHMGPTWGSVGPASASMASLRPWPLTAPLQTVPSSVAFPSIPGPARKGKQPSTPLLNFPDPAQGPC